MRKKNLIIVIIISIMMIIGGIIIFIVVNNDSINNTTSNNNNKIVEKTSCLDNLCTEKVKANFKDDSGMIQFEIKNTGNVPIQEGYFKIVFNNKKSYITRHGIIEPNNKENVEIELYKEKGFAIDNYELQYLSEEELNMVNNGQN